MAVVAARATRLPIYSAFAKEGNLSDLYAKGEAISTLFNVVGLGVGIQLASTVCSSMPGKVDTFITYYHWIFFSIHLPHFSRGLRTIIFSSLLHLSHSLFLLVP